MTTTDDPGGVPGEVPGGVPGDTSSGVSEEVLGGRRLLFVHAHPDDETINDGATMAKYAAEGAQVTLITCTRGEQGEVIPARLAHLFANGGPGDLLGDHRVAELAAAMRELGVVDHRFLGDSVYPGRSTGAVLASGARVYRDSGMAYDQDGAVVPAPAPQPGAFALAEIEELAEALAAVIREVRPRAVVGYEPGGGYGHPDHIQAHRVMMRAVELAAAAGEEAAREEAAGEEAAGQAGAQVGWAVPKVYWSVLPESLTRATLDALAAAEGDGYRGPDPVGRLPSMVVPDDQVSTAIDATAFTAAKVAALRAHETQISVSADDEFFALSNGVRRPILGLEFYRLVHGEPAGDRDDLGRETDLLA